MHASNALAVLLPNTYVVSCTFTEGRSKGSYDYLTDIPGIGCGDYVVVVAPDFAAAVQGHDAAYAPAAKVPKTVKVVEIHSLDDVDVTGDKQYSWVLQAVDMAAHAKRAEEILRLQSAINERKAQNARTQLTQQLHILLGTTDLSDITAVIGNTNQA